MKSSCKDKVQLSYSSSQLLASCEQKYTYYKVLGCKPDEDAVVDTDAFKVGKAFHRVLEECSHKVESLPSLEEKVKESCDLEGTEEYHLVYAMVKEYSELHYLSGLEAVACEFKIDHPEILGFIDVVFTNPLTGKWSIADLKTAARWDEGKVSFLPNDPQLNLYCHFVPHIAEHFNLNPELFEGVRYRVTTKSKAKGGNKSFEAYYQQVSDVSVKSVEVFIPKSLLNVKDIWERHLELSTRASELFNGEVPKRNYGNCFSFFKPCEYFSKCHGITITEATKLKESEVIKVYDKHKYQSELNYIEIL